VRVRQPKADQEIGVPGIDVSAMEYFKRHSDKKSDPYNLIIFLLILSDKIIIAQLFKKKISPTFLKIMCVLLF
jgi:hypothetical protein